MVHEATDSGYRKYIVRPCALAGRRPERPVALACILALGAIFILELMTPDDVVGALALLPVAAAVWMFSSRMAAAIVGAGALFFTLAILLEPRNRLTLLLVAIPALATAAFVRLCATSLSVRRVADEQRNEAFGSPAVPRLTCRELEVARLAARAYTAAQIGQQLHIGERTVESHIASTYVKLGIRSRSELIRMASNLG